MYSFISLQGIQTEDINIWKSFEWNRLKRKHKNDIYRNNFSKLKFIACGCFSQYLHGFTGNGSGMRFFLTQTCKILSKSSCVFTKSIHMFEKTYFAPTEKQILRQVLYETCQTQKPYVYLLKWDLFCIKYTRELEWRRVLNSVGEWFVGKIWALIRML